jgi:hypothetical protein
VPFAVRGKNSLGVVFAIGCRKCTPGPAAAQRFTQLRISVSSHYPRASLLTLPRRPS